MSEKFEVGDAQSGERLDRFLLRAVPGASATQIEDWLSRGAIRIRGKVPKPLRRLHRGDVVELERPAPVAVELASAAPIPVLFESASVVVVNKPAGISVEPEGRAPSVVGTLARQLDGWNVAGKALPGVVHRLDKETSGALLLARDDAAVAALLAAFEAGTIAKTYLVLALGDAPPEGSLDTPYSRHPRDPRRYTTHVSSARRARLAWNTLARGAGVSALEVRLFTGRTHQIRVQLSESNLPVLGDTFYGPRDARSHPLGFGRQALHAWKLSFPDPATSAVQHLEAPLPAAWKPALTAVSNELVQQLSWVE